MNLLLAALGSDVKPAGKDKWVARCPVHGDKDFAMGIKQVGDGSVIANCLACGANGLELYRYLGLDLSELFGNKEQDSTFMPPKLREEYSDDRRFIRIFKHDEHEGRNISYADNMRYKLAVSRSRNLRERYGL